MRRDQALGLPPGSVRAILAILLTAGLIGAVFAGLPDGQIAVISGAAGIALGGYFGRGGGAQSGEGQQQ